MDKKNKKKTKKLTPNELKALELVSKEPGKSNPDISKQMIELGMTVDADYLTNRIGRNPQLSEKIDKMRQNAELAILERAPKAVKVVDTEMGSKSGKQRLDAAKTVLRHSIPSQDERHRPTYPQLINIETLNILQTNQRNTITHRLDEMEEDDKQAQ